MCGKFTYTPIYHTKVEKTLLFKIFFEMQKDAENSEKVRPRLGKVPQRHFIGLNFAKDLFLQVSNF